MARNGWQRLWIVISILLLIPFGIGFVYLLPSEKVVRKEATLLYFNSEDVEEHFRAEHLYMPGYGYDLGPPGTKPKLVQRSGTKIGAFQMELKYAMSNEGLKKIRADPTSERSAQIQTLRAEFEAAYMSLTVKVLGIILAVWAAVCGAVYTLGRATGWVIKGFEKQ